MSSLTSQRFLRVAIFTTEVHIQLTFTCSKSTTETLEKGVQYVQTLQ